MRDMLNPLNAELNPICYLLALLGVHHFLHVSRIRVKTVYAILAWKRIIPLFLSVVITNVILTTTHSKNAWT